MRLKLNAIFKAMILTMGMDAGSAIAAPNGGEVESGSASISGQGTINTQINQSSNKAIIKWNSFNVGSDESVNFHTPDASAITLNRITSGDASQILGHIDSNGQVWLINPNGILFGQGAQVNVAGLLASTMNITDQDFLNGNYHFTQDANNSAYIINQGNINADGGYVAMLAPQIENTGIISAELGTVAMAAGNQATLTFQNNQLLNIAVPSNVPLYDGTGKPVALTNSGTIQADGGQVLLTAAGMNELLDESINVTGIIKADTVSEQAGKIILTASGNTILDNATISAQGGSVEVLGQHEVKLLDNTSVNASGGDIRIGHDARDDTVEQRSVEATYTQIDPNVVLRANFLETSGDKLSENSGHIYANNWLIDPYNLTISDSSDNHVSNSSPFEPDGSSSNLSVSTLETALETGDVIVQTNNQGTGNGDITILNDVVSNSTHSLSLDAVGAVNINGAALTLGGALNITAGNGIADDGQPVTVAGVTTLAAPGHDIIFNLSPDDNSNDFSTLVVTSADNVYVNDKNDLTVDTSTVTGHFDIHAGTGGTGNLTQTGTLTSTDSVSGTQDEIELSASGKVIQNGMITTTGSDILLNGNSDVTQTGTLFSGDTNSGANGVELYSYTGTVVQNGQISTSGSTVDMEAPIGDVLQGANAGITTGGPLTITGNNIHLDGTGNNFTGSITLNGRGYPMNFSLTNSGYSAPTLDLNNEIIVGGGTTFSSFALDLPGYNPNPGADTTLGTFITNNILPSVPNSVVFDLNLNLPQYASAIQAGDDTSGASTNLIDLTHLSTADTLHNLTVQTAGDVSLVFNNSAPTTPFISASAVDLESSGANKTVLVQTGQVDNTIQINSGLTLKTTGASSTIAINGGAVAQIQTPILNTTTTGGAIDLTYLKGIDGGNLALNMTENNTSMPNLTINSGVGKFNSFTLTAPNFNPNLGDMTLEDLVNGIFSNNHIINSTANFDLTLNVPADTNAITVENPGSGSGSGEYINLSPLSNSIHNVTVQSAGDLNFTQAASGTFAANNIDLESSNGNIAVNATQNNSQIEINTALTLNATRLGSTINVNNTGVGEVDTPALNVAVNDSTINLTNLTSNSSFALNATEDSSDTLSSFNAFTVGKFDSFSLTAQNYNAADTTVLYNLLNNNILTNVAKPSAFDLTLNLPSFTQDIVMGSPFFGSFISFAPLTNIIHNVTVNSDGAIALTNPSSVLNANQVNLTGTGAITASYTDASQSMTLATSSSSAAIVAARVETPSLNTTDDGGQITLDNVQGSSTAGSAFALNMTENANVMPNLVYGQNGDGYVPAYSSFSLSAPSFAPTIGTNDLERFIDRTIFPYVSAPSTFDLNLNLPSDTNTINVGDNVPPSNIDLSLLNNTIHNLTINSAGGIELGNNGGGTITANAVTLATSGAGSAITVNSQGPSDHINMSTLNTSTDGGAVTITPNTNLASLALNMTESSANLPTLTLGTPLNSFSLTAPNFNQAANTYALEDFINNTILPAATAPGVFDLALDLPSDNNTIEIGDDHTATIGQYINLDTQHIADNLAGLTIKSAGAINFTANSNTDGGASIVVNNLDLETTGFASAVNITATQTDDYINTTNMTAKATGTGLGDSEAINIGNGGNGHIATSVLNTETNVSGVAVDGITSTFALNVTEDSDNTPNLFPEFGTATISSLNVNLPNYNFGNDVSGNVSLTNWFTTIFQNGFPAASSGFSLGVNAPADPHTIRMGYDNDSSSNLIDLSKINSGTAPTFNNLSLVSAGAVDLVAQGSNGSIVANSATLETTGKLANVNVVADSSNTITLSDPRAPLTLAATGGGNITVDNIGQGFDVSASTVNTTTAGGNVDLSSVTGGTAGAITSSPYFLRMVDNSGLVPTLQTSALLNSFSYTAANLSWNVNTQIETLLDTVLTHETTDNPGANFNLIWTTPALRDELDMSALTTTNFTADYMTLLSRGAINLSAVTLGGSLNVDNNAGLQAITEDLLGNSLAVSGTTSLNAGGDIILTASGNDFHNQTVNLMGNNISVTDGTSSLNVGAVTATGNLNLTAQNGDITQATDTTISVDGTSNLDAGTNAITLTNADNSFGGAVTVGHSGITAGAVSLVEGSGSLNMVQVDDNTNTKLSSLNLTTVGGISETGPLVVTGNTTLNADLLIDLTDVNNNFNTLAITHGGNNVDIVDANSIVLGASDMTDNFDLSTGGDITQTGPLTIHQIATLNAASHNITLTNANNSLGTVGLTAGTATITNAGALALGTTNVSNLNVTAGGNITEVANTVAASGTTTLNANGHDITLDGTSNALNTVTISSANNVTLDNNAALNLGASTISGDLNVNTNGAITQAGALTVTGATTLAAGAGNDITLDSANHFDGELSLSGDNIGLSNIDPVEFGDVTATGTFNPTVFGDVTQASGTAMQISGPTTINAEANSINLSNAGNDFNHQAVSLTGSTGVQITDSDSQGLIIGSLFSDDAASVTASGPITQTGALTVGGATTINTGSDVTLTNANNALTGSVSLTGNNISLVQNGTLDLGTITAGGNVILSATQLNNTTGANAITTGAGDAWDIYLTNLDGNTFGGLASGNQAVWDTAYTPASTMTESGNRYIFGTAENLTLAPEATPFSETKTEGDSITLPSPIADENYQATGFVHAVDYDNAFTQDTVDNVAISGVNYTSEGVPVSAPAAIYPITMTGTAVATRGYTASYDPSAEFGELTVTAAPTPPAPPTPVHPVLPANSDSYNPSLVEARIETSTASWMDNLAANSPLQISMQLFLDSLQNFQNGLQSSASDESKDSQDNV